jgi:hypothetical protein
MSKNGLPTSTRSSCGVVDRELGPQPFYRYSFKMLLFPARRCTDAHNQFHGICSFVCPPPAAPTAAPNTKNESQSCYVFAPGASPKAGACHCRRRRRRLHRRRKLLCCTCTGWGCKVSSNSELRFRKSASDNTAGILVVSCSITVPLVPARGKQPDSRTESQLQASLRRRNGMPRHKKKA